MLYRAFDRQSGAPDRLPVGVACISAPADPDRSCPGLRGAWRLGPATWRRSV